MVVIESDWQIPKLVSKYRELYHTNSRLYTLRDWLTYWCVYLWYWQILNMNRRILGNRACHRWASHCCDVVMTAMASQITSLTIVYSIVYSGASQRKHRSSASLAFARGIHRWPVNSPHIGPVTRKMFTFDDVIISRKFTLNNFERLYTQKSILLISLFW